MSGNTTTAGTPLSSLGAPAAVAATDAVLMLVTSGAVTLTVLAPVSVLLASALLLSGGQMTGMLTLSAAPTLPGHASTKAYVDLVAEQTTETVAANAAAAAQSAAGAAQAVQAARGASGGVAALDPSGTLILNGRAAWAVDADGNLVAAAMVQDTNDGFLPVAGSRVVYTDGGILKVAL